MYIGYTLEDFECTVVYQIYLRIQTYQIRIKYTRAPVCTLNEPHRMYSVQCVYQRHHRRLFQIQQPVNQYVDKFSKIFSASRSSRLVRRCVNQHLKNHLCSHQIIQIEYSSVSCTCILIKCPSCISSASPNTGTIHVC